MKHFYAIFIITLISILNLDGKDTAHVEYKYSNVMDIPDLSFLNNVYTGLDILEQMDYKHINNQIATEPTEIE